MNYPNFKEEKKLWRQGYQLVIGLDESGRGPLAGPVVAASVSLSPLSYKFTDLKGLNDSKKLSENKRKFFYKILTNNENIKYGIGIVSVKIIDKINILEATKLAMQKSVNQLYRNFHSRENYNMNNILLIDGNFKIKSKIPQRSIIKGDEKVFSIAAAGIIAKVTRDEIMKKLHKKYPQYGFHLHKGYGTKLHIKNLKNFNFCEIHRKSFYPISTLI